jgi:hypothetical protein
MMMRIVKGHLAAVLLAVALLASCGDSPPTSSKAAPPPDASVPTGDPAAIATCQARSLYTELQLEAGFRTTVGAMRRWHPSVIGRNSEPMPEPQFLAGRPPSEQLTTCYLKGAVGTPHPPDLPPHDRALIMIDVKGNVELMFAGSSDRGFGIERPVDNQTTP